MAFPGTGVAVLDNGVRGDEDPISNGGKWSHWVPANPDDLAISGNHIIAGGQNAFDYWNDATFSGQTQTQIEFASTPTVGESIYMGLNSVHPESATLYCGYLVGFFIGASLVASAVIYRVDNNSITVLKNPVTVGTVGTGSKIGFEYNGGVLGVYLDGILTDSYSSDTTYTSGYVGLGLGVYSGTTYNVFYGGAVTGSGTTGSAGQGGLLMGVGR